MEHDAALEQLRHAVEIAPSSAYAHFNLGDASMWCGRCDEALVHLDRALRLDPNDHGVFLTIRGVTLWMMGELREARGDTVVALDAYERLLRLWDEAEPIVRRRRASIEQHAAALRPRTRIR